MPASTSKLVALTLTVAALGVSAAPAAATPELQSDTAMRKAIRDYAKRSPGGEAMRARNIRVDCVQAAKVGTTRPCSGTFSLTRGSRIAHYRLTERASTFRNSPGSIEYRLYAEATRKAPGLPSSIASWRGFLQ